MRKFSVILVLLLSLVISCSSYTLAEGRENITIPEYKELPITKLDKNSLTQGINANALFVDLGTKEISNDEKALAIEMLKAIEPDIIVLMGSLDNQIAVRGAFNKVYELQGVSIIISEKLANTQMIELYIGDFPAILAETQFPILDSVY